MKYKLAILICTIPGRADFLLRLMNVLLKQKTDDVVILSDDTVGISIGEKRNALLRKGVSLADYVVFIDDDDMVVPNYVARLLDGILLNATHCSLRGVITEDGRNARIFEHSTRHKAYETITDPEGYADIKYLRYPNHLNCIQSEIARHFTFPTINHGEDTNWATQIFQSGLLNNEYWIDDIIYYYEYRSKK